MRFSGSAEEQKPGAATAGAVEQPEKSQREMVQKARQAVLDLMRTTTDATELEAILGNVPSGNSKALAAEQKTRTAVAQVVAQERKAASDSERRALVDQILHELRGYGPLEPLLKQRDRWEEIEINRWDRVYVVPGGGEPILTDVTFWDEEHLRFVAQRLLGQARRRVTDAEPMIDASLPGMRVNVVLQPTAVDGTCITIRLHQPHRKPGDLVANGTITEDALHTLETLVAGGLNVLVTGGTASGKTTLLNLISNYIPEEKRIVTVEDAVELQIRDGNVIRMETRPPNIERVGEITIRDLVRNAMRQRPEYIIIGEMRGAEALDVLVAANSGHSVFSTIHANTAGAALYKLATYAAMSDERLSEAGLAYQVSNAFHVVVHVQRMGKVRRVMQISEVGGVSPSGQVEIRDIYRYRDGALQRTGLQPQRWVEELVQRGKEGRLTWLS